MMEPDSLARSRPRGVRSLLKWLGIALAIVIVLATATVFVARSVLHERVVREREIVATDPPAPPGRARLEGKDPAAWLEQIAKSEPQGRPGTPDEPCYFTGLSSGPIQEVLAAVAHELESADARFDLRECGLELLRADQSLRSEQLALALEAATFGSFRLAPPRSETDTDPPLAAALPLHGHMQAYLVLCESAWLAAARGEHELALANLRLALRALRTFDARTSFHVALCVFEGERTWLRTLSLVARELPGDVGVAEFESVPDEFNPWPEVEAAWQAERTTGLQAIAWMRTQTEGGFEPGPIWLGNDAWLDHEETLFLQAIATSLAHARAHTNPGPGPNRSPRSWDTISAMLTQNVDKLHASALELDALRKVVHAFLIARRDGPQAAIDWASAQVDPFDRHPLRTRLVDEVLLVWSIGRDLTDDVGDPVSDISMALRVR